MQHPFSSARPSRIVPAILTAFAIVSLLAWSPAWAGDRPGDDPPFRIRLEEETSAFLGIGLRDAHHRDGVRVISVVPGSAASAAGLMPGDTIIGFNGSATGDSAALGRQIRALAVGDRATVTVVRDGDEIALDATLGTRGAKIRFEARGDWFVWTPTFRGHVNDGTLIGNGVDDPDSIYVCQGRACRFGDESIWYRAGCIDEGCPTYRVNWSGRPVLGVGIVDTTAELRWHLGGDDASGVLVGRVHAESPAERAGVEVGDLILAIDGRSVARGRDIQRALRDASGRSVDLDVTRDGRPIRLVVDLPEYDVDSPTPR